jgi:hypothetical protein
MRSELIIPGQSVVRITNHEQVIYDHLLACLQVESSDQILKRFHQLFILGTGYPDTTIRQTLEDFVRLNGQTDPFFPFFNRCCFILVNRWQMTATERGAIPKLLDLLLQVQTVAANASKARSTARLRLLVYHFTQSEHFKHLQRMAEFSRLDKHCSPQQPLLSLIDRYPYIYQHCLVSKEKDTISERAIQLAKIQTEAKFEKDLSQYVTSALFPANRDPNRPLIQTIQNPTLLSDRELTRSIKHYVGKSTQQGTYRDMASHFTKTIAPLPTFKTFKDNLYDYIITDLDANYGRCRFNNQLHEMLKQVSPDQHLSKINDVLVTRTYHQLLNFLVIESRQNPKHFIFMDLISNIGSTHTVGLLLKVLLLSSKVKSSLERRLALLFNHYESQQQATVQWLVRCFEKMNVALATHFGKLDFSFVNVL